MIVTVHISNIRNIFYQQYFHELIVPYHLGHIFRNKTINHITMVIRSDMVYQFVTDDAQIVCSNDCYIELLINIHDCVCTPFTF